MYNFMFPLQRAKPSVLFRGEKSPPWLTPGSPLSGGVDGSAHGGQWSAVCGQIMLHASTVRGNNMLIGNQEFSCAFIINSIYS